MLVIPTTLGYCSDPAYRSAGQHHAWEPRIGMNYHSPAQDSQKLLLANIILTLWTGGTGLVLQMKYVQGMYTIIRDVESNLEQVPTKANRHSS